MSLHTEQGKLGEGVPVARGGGLGACFCSLLNLGKLKAFYFYFLEDSPWGKGEVGIHGTDIEIKSEQLMSNY